MAKIGPPIIWENSKDNFQGYLAANPASQYNNYVVLVGNDDSGNGIVEAYQAQNPNMTAINSLLLKKK
jgi:hypothetical protein